MDGQKGHIMTFLSLHFGPAVGQNVNFTECFRVSEHNCHVVLTLMLKTLFKII